MFHSHPSQLSGAFQSVSSDNVLRGTSSFSKAGYTESSMAVLE